MAELKGAGAREVYRDVTTGAFGREPSNVCETCLVENNNRPAVGWCETCDERLCDDCYKTHCRPKRMREHQLCSIADMKIRKQRKKVANRCEKHEGELLKFFCEDHSELGCSQCFVTKHRLCSKVVCISEVNTSESVEFKALCNMLSDLDMRLKVNERNTERNSARTAKQNDEAITNIKKTGEKLNTLIDELVKNQIAKSQKIKDDNSMNMEDMEETIKVVTTRLQRSRELLAAEKEDNNQLFLTMKHIQREAKLLQSKLQESEKKTKVSEYEFVLNPELASVLEKVTELGTLTDKHILNMEKATDEVVDEADEYIQRKEIVDKAREIIQSRKVLDGTDGVVNEMEMEVRRFGRTSSRGTWINQSEHPAAICVTTDHDIRLLDVLLFPCLEGDTIVKLFVFDDKGNSVNCKSTHKNTTRDILAVKVPDIGVGHSITLQAGHRYCIIVYIKGSASHYGVDGQASITVAGVKFSFTVSPGTQELMMDARYSQQRQTLNELMNRETTVSKGQIAGFRFTRL